MLFKNQIDLLCRYGFKEFEVKDRSSIRAQMAPISAKAFWTVQCGQIRPWPGWHGMLSLFFKLTVGSDLTFSANGPILPSLIWMQELGLSQVKLDLAQISSAQLSSDWMRPLCFPFLRAWKKKKKGDRTSLNEKEMKVFRQGQQWRRRW